ncbi:MAG TPA: hypothetical protein PKY30_01180 [Myxococcota bacterium]|nr:hypothetical protein [Myxococcota bacterium]HNH45615.1 hypothetical protein [Myxococcota bacterium]
MPGPAPHPPDDFRAAALRHYDDACLLLDQGRHDNAVYLAGYVQECSFKSSLFESARSSFSGKELGHNLRDAGPAELIWQALLSDRSPQQLAEIMAGESVLQKGHPNRRYWPTYWNSDQADDAVKKAGKLLEVLVLTPLLDRGGPLP